ncbi:MAG TPA: SH3 domain-containing protein [Azospirillum sp.]|nr:SH3 domain-containing protein [Azospirillum sp.]
MRRRSALLSLVLAVLAPAGMAPAVQAQTAPAPAGEERFTPRALPTPVAPKLTPLLPPDAKGAAVPKPAAAVLPLPSVAPPLSPVTVPGAPPPPPPLRPLPPAAEAPPPVSLPAGQVAPPPPRKPAAAAPPPAFIEPALPPVAAPAPPPAPPTATAVRPPPEAAPPPVIKDAGKEKAPEKAPEKITEKAPEKGRNRTAWAKDDVYVRATPDRDGKVLDALLPGEKVEVLPEAVDRWSRVARNGKVLGYVASSYLLDKPPSARAASSGGGASDDDGCALPPDIPSGRRVSLEEGSRARILADANLRDAPGCRGRVLDVLEEGETVTVSAEQNGWYRVARNGRTLGYISGALLAKAR